MDIGDQYKSWGPHVICDSCRSDLEGWLRGSGRHIICGSQRTSKSKEFEKNPKIIMMIAIAACMIKTSKYRKVKERIAITYPIIFSFIAPDPHGDTLPAPKAHHQM